MIDPDEIRLRYSKVEVATDKRDRAITVGRLKPSQQARIADMAGDNTGGLFRIVACVRKIDDDDISFPKTRAELESLMDRLDEEGLEAAGKALMTLAGVDAEGQSLNVMESAKNS